MIGVNHIKDFSEDDESMEESENENNYSVSSESSDDDSDDSDQNGGIRIPIPTFADIVKRLRQII